jgi:hypothetical protein
MSIPSLFLTQHGRAQPLFVQSLGGIGLWWSRAGAPSSIRWSPFCIANSGVLERPVQFELSLEGYLVHQVTDGSLSAGWLFFNQSLASCRIKLENSPNPSKEDES